MVPCSQDDLTNDLRQLHKAEKPLGRAAASCLVCREGSGSYAKFMAALGDSGIPNVPKQAGNVCSHIGS